LLDLVLPTDCGGCGVPGHALCPDCKALLAVPVPVHPSCCPARLPVYALGTYDGALRTTLLAYKERGRRDLAAPLGDALASALLPFPGLSPERSLRGGMWLVPVPSGGAAASRRGGQHVALVAQRAAAALAGAGVEAGVAPGLRMGRGVRDSIGLGAPAR